MQKKVCLGDLATYINGYAFKPSDWGQDGLPIIRIQNLTGNAYEVNYFSGNLDKRYFITNGDVLISWSASIGVYEWQNGDAWLNQHIFKVKFDKENVDKKYFQYAVGYVLEKSLKFAHGSTMKHLTKKVFDSLQVPYYDMDTQRQIVDKLAKLDKAIKYYEEIHDCLDELVKSRFVEMFGDPVSNSMGWKIVKLIDVCDKVTDGTHFSPESYAEGDYKYVTAKNIKESGFDFTNITYVTKDIHSDIFSRCNPEYGDVLYIKDGVTTGIAMVNTLHEEFSLLSSVALIKQKRDVLNGIFLCAVLNNANMYRTIRSMMGGAAITRLTVAKIKPFKIIIPPINLQNQFADFVVQTDKSKLAVQQSIETLQTLKAKLMQDYFG